MPGLLTLLAYTLSFTAGLSLGDERQQVAAVVVAVAGAVQLGLRLTRGRRRTPVPVPVAVPVPVVPTVIAS